MTYKEIKRILSKMKEELSRKFGVKIGVFGSYVRGDQTPKSYVDIDREGKTFDNSFWNESRSGSLKRAKYE